MKFLTYKIALSFFFLLCTFTAYNQNSTIDSLLTILKFQKEDTGKVNSLNKIVSQLLELDSTTLAIPYAIKTKVLAEKVNYDKGKALAYFNLIRIYLNQEKYAEAMNWSLLARDINIELKNKSTIAEIYNIISYIYMRQLNLSEALKSQYNSLKIYEELKDTGKTAYSLYNIATINHVQENNTEGLKNFLASLKLYELVGNMEGIANNYQGIASIYVGENKFEEALRKDSAALKIFTQLNNSWSIAWCLSSIGKIFEMQGSITSSAGDKALAETRYNNASYNYLAALRIFKNIEDNNAIIKLFSKLGNINFKLGKFKEAKSYFDSSMKLAKESGDIETLKYNHEGFSRLDSVAGNYKKAYEHYKMYIFYRDKLADEEGKKKSLQTTIQYAFDKKETIARAEQEKKDAQAKRIKSLQYFTIGGLCFVVLIVLLFSYSQWKNNKHKQKANLLLQQQKEKVESTLSELKSTQAQLIQSEKMASLGELTAGIAHEIQNPLNFVNNFSEVNKELVDELQQELKAGKIDDAIAISNDIKDNEQKINHHGKRADAIVKNMLQHSRSSSGQKEPTDINKLADEYLRLAYHGLRAKDKSFNATLKTDFDESIGNINIIPQDIGRVILNLFTNAFYAVNEKKQKQLNAHPDDPFGRGYDPTVSVITKKLNEQVEIIVKDNGMGISQPTIEKIFQPFFTTKPSGQGTGLGLSMSYDIIVKGHGGELIPESEEGVGTNFIIRLPDKF